MRIHLASALVLLAAACSSGSTDTARTGEVSFVLTQDETSDELTQFAVDVSNITLTKLNGNTVSAVPKATRIDFVELDALGELIAGLTLDAGVYTRLTMDLDFSNAEVLIAGQSTAATVQNQFGNPITGSIQVVLDFAAGARPVVGALRHNLFVLDLDLGQSIAVDGVNNIVTFTPVLNAELDPSNPKPIATRGILQSVNLNNRTFVLERRALDNSVLGTFTVQTNTTTVFQLDGQNGIGAPSLGMLPGYIGQYLFVQGSFTANLSPLNAVAVETGAGVPGNGQDWVIGHVTARSGGAGADATLTVTGRSLDVGTLTRHFNTQHTVNVSHADTKVLRRGSGNSLDTDAINVGQLVWIFGDISGTTLDATAATGVARLLPTAIFGVANAVPSGDSVSLDLVRFDLRDVAEFDFDVSGQVQADPDAFTVDVTGISTSGVIMGSKLRVEGWISGVGASGDDATGVSLVNRSTTARLMFCQWLTPTTAAVSQSSASTKIELNVDTATIRTVADGFGLVNLSSTPAPTIQKLAGIGVYRIIESGATELNLSFDTFRASLLTRAATTPVFRIAAFGTFDESTQAFSALTVTVILD
ncbi:MAG: hypothetical protein KDE27_05670 [Planctomycetes bacterium]|nr:hypothetical protein [Planctomycetota bacterium]